MRRDEAQCGLCLLGREGVLRRIVEARNHGQLAGCLCPNETLGAMSVGIDHAWHDDGLPVAERSLGRVGGFDLGPKSDGGDLASDHKFGLYLMLGLKKISLKKGS